jgi:hypothetical protein
MDRLRDELLGNLVLPLAVVQNAAPPGVVDRGHNVRVI